MRKLLSIVLFIPIVLSACARAETTPLKITGAWARPALTGQTSAVYLTIDNPGKAGDVLQAARTDVAQMTELHMTQMDDQGVMSMHPQHSLDIPASGQVKFEPGGLHVMLVDLKQDVKPGDTIALTLVFEKNGEIVITVPVKEAP